MKRIINKIIDEIEIWTSHREIEMSPLGGNIVKVAQYGGTVAGLRIALNILQEEKNSHIKKNEKCPCCDETA